jgi:PKD repeat protein
MARIGIWVQRIAIATVVAVVAGLAVRVGTSASEALEFRDPTAWLASSVTGDVVLANALTGEVQARVDVGNPGDSLAVAPTTQGLVAINRSKGEAVFVDPATEKKSDRRAVSGIDPTSVLLRSNAGPRLVSGSVVVAFEGPTGDQIRSVDLPETLTGAVATAKGAVYGVGTRTGSIRRVTDGVSDVQVPGSVAVSLSNDEVYAITGGDEPVVAHVEGTDATGARPCAAFAVSTPGAGAAQSDDARFVVVADGASGRLSITDLDRRTCRSVTVARAGSTIGAPVVDAGIVYVPVYSSGDVVTVPAAGDGAPTTAGGLGTPGKAFDLFAKDHFVWFNDPVGKLVAVLSDGVVNRKFNKYDEAADGTITTPGVSSGKGNTGSGSGTGSGAPGTAGATSGNTGTTPGGAATTAGGATSASSGSKTTGEGGGTGTRNAGKGAADPNSPPPDSNALVADFTFSSSVVPVNEKVTFTDKSTGAPTAWTWDFGDNSFAAGPKVDKSWAQPGFYIVKLTVEANGNSSIATTTIEVTALEGKVRPKANFGFSAAQAEVGQPITFTDKSTGSPTELKWNFGDDATGAGSPIQHVWSKPGTFTVVLSATNSSGTDSAQATITIFAKVEPPVSKIIVDVGERWSERVVAQCVDGEPDLAAMELRRRHHRFGCRGRTPVAGPGRVCGDPRGHQLGRVVDGPGDRHRPRGRPHPGGEAPALDLRHGGR